MLPLVLHSIGGTGWVDEILLFGGIGLVILVLLGFSWREGRRSKNKKQERKKP